MKFNKTTLIVLVVCVLVFCAAVLGWVYSQQNEQLKKLNTQLVTAQKKLAQIKLDDLNQQNDQINLQIKQFNEQLASNKARLRFKEDSIDVTSAILEIAKSYRINIIEIRSPGLSNEELAGTSLSTLTVELSIRGNIDDIASFIPALNKRFPTSIVALVQLNKVKAEPAPSPEPEQTPVLPTQSPIIPPEKDFNGTLNFVIYNYEGN
jgi:hypothetical protein